LQAQELLLLLLLLPLGGPPPAVGWAEVVRQEELLLREVRY
jgi:hypothetical protein